MTFSDESVRVSAAPVIPAQQAWAAYVRRRWPRDCVSHVQSEWDLSPGRARGIVYGNGARDAVNSHFKRMTADLKFTRKEFETEVIAQLAMTAAEFEFAERKRARLQRLAGLREGEQLDLVDLINDTVDDKIDAEANGYRAGLRGDDPTPADHISPILHPDWMAGWHRGQAVQCERFIKAQAIIEARQAKPPMVAEDPEDDADPLDPDAINAEARKLKKAGWTEPAPEEAEFADAAA